MAETAEKARRQQEILRLLGSRDVASQEELGRLLDARGISATQSTLSRDMKELGVVRVPTGEGYRYRAVEAGQGPPAATRLHPADVVEVVSNEVAVVVRTLVGRAQGVAVALDALALPEVLGTLAGDDTILVLPKTTRDVRKLHVRLESLTGLTHQKEALPT